MRERTALAFGAGFAVNAWTAEVKLCLLNIEFELEALFESGEVDESFSGSCIDTSLDLVLMTDGGVWRREGGGREGEGRGAREVREEEGRWAVRLSGEGYASR